MAFSYAFEMLYGYTILEGCAIVCAHTMYELEYNDCGFLLGRAPYLPACSVSSFFLPYPFNDHLPFSNHTITTNLSINADDRFKASSWSPPEA